MSVIQSAISSIRKKADEILNDNQGWFRGGKFTPQQITHVPGQVANVGYNIATKTVPTFLNTVKNDVYSFGEGLGKAINAHSEANRLYNSAINEANISNQNIQKAIQLKKQGDIEGYKRLLTFNNKPSSLTNDINRFLGETEKNKAQTVVGAVKTAGYLPSVFGGGIGQYAVGGLLGAGASALQGQDPYVGAGKAIADTKRANLITQFSSPLTRSLVGSVGGKFDNPIVKGLYSRVVGGVSNVVENEAIARIENNHPGAIDRALAFGIGFAASGPKSADDLRLKDFGKMMRDEWDRSINRSGFAGMPQNEKEILYKIAKHAVDTIDESANLINKGINNVAPEFPGIKSESEIQFLKRVNNTPLSQLTEKDMKKAVELGSKVDWNKRLQVGQGIRKIDNVERLVNQSKGVGGEGVTKEVVDRNYQVATRQLQDAEDLLERVANPNSPEYEPKAIKRASEIVNSLEYGLNKAKKDLEKFYKTNVGSPSKGVGTNQLEQTKTGLPTLPETQLGLPKSSKGQIVDNQVSSTGNIPQKPTVDNLVPNQSVSVEPKIPTGKAKLRVEGEKTAKQKSFLESVAQSEKSTEPLVQQTKALDQSYTPITNKQSISQARSLIKKSPDEAKNLVFSDAPVDSVKITTGIELAKRYEKQGNIDEAVAMINELDQQLRRAGQGIQAASLWNKMSPETLLRTANRIAEKSKQKLPQEVQNNILTRMRKVSKMSEGTDKDAATMDVLNYIADNVKPTVGEVFDSYRYTNLLSNPRTHERNIYGNLFNTLVTRPLDIGLNATYDFIKNPTNPMARDISFSDVPTYYKNVFASLGNAFDAAKEGMKAKNLEFDATGAETAIEALRRERVPGVFKAIPKFMQAQDQFFSTLIASGEKARLMKRGLSDEAASTQAKRLAEKYLLREKLGKSEAGYIVKALDSLGSLAMSGRKLPVIGKLWSWFVPFVTTPINFAKMSVEHSLLGLPGAKMTTENIAKATAGSLFMAYAGKLAMEDRTTLSAPTDAKQKELFYASGKKPFSVKIGDNWIPLNYFGPFGLSLMVPAALKQRFQDDPGAYTDDVALKATRTVADISKYLASQTPLQGIGSFVSLLDGDSDFTLQSITGSMATQAIPLSGASRWVNSVIDNIYRKGYDFKSQILKSIPGGTFNLEAYTNPTGEPTERLPQNQFIPYDTGKENPMYAELEQQRIEKLQANREDNLLKKQLEQGKTVNGVSGNKIAYINEEGTPSILDLTKYDKIAELPSDNKYNSAIRESKQYSEAAKILDNTALSQEQQQAALARLGIEPDKASYYQVANDNDDLKTMFVLDAVNKVKSSGGGFADVIQLLAQQRTEINGKQIASNGVLDNLVDEGILTKSQATELKKYKFENGQLTLKKPSSSKTKAKKISVTLRKVSARTSVPRSKVYKFKKPKLTYKKLKPIKLKAPLVANR